MNSFNFSKVDIEKEKELCIFEMRRVRNILKSRDDFSVSYEKQPFEELISDIGNHYKSIELGLFEKYNGVGAIGLVENKLATRLINFGKGWDIYQYNDSYDNDEMAYHETIKSLRNQNSLKQIYRELVSDYEENFGCKPLNVEERLLTDSVELKPPAKEIDKSKNIDIYVDGSFNAETGNYGYGVYVPVTKRALSGSGVARCGGRNIEGEVAGASRAINFALQQMYSEITIYHDYEGIGRWGDKTWKRNKPYTQTYSELVDKASETLKINFVHVHGHTGVKENEIVDSIAKKACGVEMTNAEKALLDECDFE